MLVATSFKLTGFLADEQWAKYDVRSVWFSKGCFAPLHSIEQYDIWKVKVAYEFGVLEYWIELALLWPIENLHSQIKFARKEQRLSISGRRNLHIVVAQTTLTWHFCSHLLWSLPLQLCINSHCCCPALHHSLCTTIDGIFLHWLKFKEVGTEH